VIVSAGFSPNRKTYPFQEKTMARLMAEELMSFGVKENELIIGNERWGSLGEIEEVWLQALHFATLHNLLDLDVRIVTSWYHSPRVRLIMWRIAHDVRSGVCRALQSSNKPPETYCLEYSTWSTSGSVTHALWELVKTPITALKLLGL
jgi:hypothetical protein